MSGSLSQAIIRSVAVLLPGLLICNLDAAASVLEYRGVARDLQTGAIAYQEHHQVKLDEQGRVRERQVDYFDAQGNRIVTKLNQSTALPWVTAFEKRDWRTDSLEALRIQPDGIELIWQDAAMDRPQTTRIDPQPGNNWVADAGFDAFVIDHLPALVARQTVYFQFLVPARQRSLEFALIPRQVAETQIEVAMVLKNPLLRWMLESIVLVYSRSPARLLSYRGLTNIDRGDGSHYEALITYEYPQTASHP